LKGIHVGWQAGLNWHKTKVDRSNLSKEVISIYK
jgi:hypothetical protein